MIEAVRDPAPEVTLVESVPELPVSQQEPPVSQQESPTPESPLVNLEQPENAAGAFQFFQSGQWRNRDLKGFRYYLKEWAAVCREFFGAHALSIAGGFWSLRTPLFLLAAIALAPKMVLVWIAFILVKPLSVFIYQRLPDYVQGQMQSALPRRVRESKFVQEISDGADQGLPFILFWLYLCCAPFALGWMAVHWVRNFLPAQSPKFVQGEDQGLVLVQNPRSEKQNPETNFYTSRVFGLVVFAFFALGIPAFFSYSVYEKLGMEKTMQGTGVMLLDAKIMFGPPQKSVPPVGLAATAPPEKLLPPKALASLPIEGVGKPVPPYGADATVVMGYNGYWPWLHHFGVTPSKASIFFVHFYLLSLATAMCVLFFRAWFQFPLEFLGDEHEIEITTKGLKRKSLKGWFLSVISFNRFAIGAGPDRLDWSEVRSLRRLEEGFTKLYPLPESAFKRESFTYRLLNKVAALIDGLSDRINNKGNFLVFSGTSEGSDLGRNIKINLGDLNKEQRAKLFYAVRRWAPHVAIHESAEQQLVGSTVLKDTRYTQLWFDMLTSRSRTKRKNVLNAGESLKAGGYKIEERISSGGQATTYAATKSSGEKVVLKEFILSTSTDSTVLIESAREFEAEVSLLSQLDHPGIVKLEDFFFEEGRVYVVLEYIAGQSLRQRVQANGAMSEAEAVRIGKAICAVLEYLHSANPAIVHRDITPENILIMENGDVKLIDFSLAVRRDGRQTTNSCAKQCFTPPEQFREEVTVQSDIYALGATLYYLLTGSTPKPISCSSPKQKVEHICDKLNAIVARATKLELKDRYETAAWLKLDLEQLK